MPDIAINIKNKIPTLSEPAEIVTDNTDYTVHFNWDAEWEAIQTKTAIFVSGSGQTHTVIMDGTNSCAVPMITASWGVVYIGLQAGELHTTTACAVRILPSIARQLGSSAPEADRDWWSQIMERLTSPVEKTAAMTQPVGRDADGKLWTAPGGGLSPAAAAKLLSILRVAHPALSEDIDELEELLTAEPVGPDVPDEPEELAIVYDGTVAVITGLAGLNIVYSGTTAEIGG